MNKKKEIVIYIILFILGLVVGAFGIIVFTNDDSNEELNVNNDVNNSDLLYNVIDNINNEGIAEKELYVGGKLVVFENQRSKFSNIVVKQFNKDILVVEASLSSGSLYVVNKDAEVIGVFSKEDNDYYEGIKKLPTKANYRDTYRIDGNNIYVQSDVFSNGGDDYYLCNVATDNSQVVVYEEKFEYLGNNEFSKPVIVKAITREQYMKENNIVCK